MSRVELRYSLFPRVDSFCNLSVYGLDKVYYSWLNSWLNGYLDKWLNGWSDEWLNKWLNSWLNSDLDLWLLVTLVVGSLVWLSNSLQTKKLLLETLELAADGNHISAAAALEWLADHALFLAAITLVDQLVLSIGQTVDCWVEQSLYVSGV